MCWNEIGAISEIKDRWRGSIGNGYWMVVKIILKLVIINGREFLKKTFNHGSRSMYSFYSFNNFRGSRAVTPRTSWRAPTTAPSQRCRRTSSNDHGSRRAARSPPRIARPHRAHRVPLRARRHGQDRGRGRHHLRAAGADPAGAGRRQDHPDVQPTLQEMRVRPSDAAAARDAHRRHHH